MFFVIPDLIRDLLIDRRKMVITNNNNISYNRNFVELPLVHRKRLPKRIWRRVSCVAARG